jgi:hypothetical protein
LKSPQKDKLSNNIVKGSAETVFAFSNAVQDAFAIVMLLGLIIVFCIFIQHKLFVEPRDRIYIQALKSLRLEQVKVVRLTRERYRDDSRRITEKRKLQGKEISDFLALLTGASPAWVTQQHQPYKGWSCGVYIETTTSIRDFRFLVEIEPITTHGVHYALGGASFRNDALGPFIEAQFSKNNMPLLKS